MAVPSVADAAREGRLEGLHALRDRLASAIDLCDSMRDLASLSLRLTEVLAQIEDASVGTGEFSPLDEIAARRAARSA